MISPSMLLDRFPFGGGVLLSLLLCCIPVAALAQTPVLTAQVVAGLPHDPEAFTQGLLFHDGSFYESTGLYGQSSLRRVEPTTGRLLARRALPGTVFGEGLTLVGDRLYQLTWRSGRVLVSRLSDFKPLGEFSLPTEGWGLCELGGRLVVSDGSDRLFFYDPKSMAPRGFLRVTDAGEPVSRLNELEVVDGNIWANVWGDTRIAVIDPVSGRVRVWVDCSGLLPGVTAMDPDNVLNGIAYDPATGRVWVTGKRWTKVYEIKVPGLPLGMSR